MIDAKELRIGNWIYWNEELKKGVAHKVILIGEFHLYTIPISLGPSLNDYQPIPLTPEILEKCGFIKDRSTMSLLGGYIIWFERREDKLFLCTDESSKQILFLHDFQNIYFALNGEELKINL